MPCLLSLIQALLEINPNLINKVDQDKMTALHIACTKAKKEVCAHLVSKKSE